MDSSPSNSRNAPLVTVAIPTYNRADGLERALASVRQLDYPALDIVVSDNASTDGTAELCKHIAAEDPRVRVVRHPENRGLPGNFAACLEQARGEYFMWLADDDRLAPDYLSVCVEMLETQADLVLAGGLAEFPEKPDHRHNLIVLDQEDPFARVSQFLWNGRDNSIFYGLYRTALIRQIGLRSGVAGDWLTVAGMAAFGKVIMTDRTRLFRASGGASRSHAHTVRVLGLPRWQAHCPKLVIALNFRRFFLREYPFDNFSPTERRALARHAFVVSLARKKAFRPLLWGIPRARRPYHLWPTVRPWAEANEGEATL